MVGATKAEFFHADEVRPQRLLEPPEETAGLRVAGLKDLLAIDADEDDSLPMSKTELTQWWRRRQAGLVRNLGR